MIYFVHLKILHAHNQHAELFLYSDFLHQYFSQQYFMSIARNKCSALFFYGVWNVAKSKNIFMCFNFIFIFLKFSLKIVFEFCNVPHPIFFYKKLFDYLKKKINRGFYRHKHILYNSFLLT